MRPSSVKINWTKMDARLWRVNIFIEDGVIQKIEQEVEVGLYEGVEHGYALEMLLRSRPRRILPVNAKGCDKRGSW